MLNDLGGDDGIELIVHKRQPLCVALNDIVAVRSRSP